MPPAQPRFEEVAGQRLPLGGANGYLGVRGKQGRKKDKFQGITPRKQHRTKLFDTALEAAMAFAQMKEDIELGMLELRSSKKLAASPTTTTGSRRFEVGTFLGHLKQLPRAIPTVSSALLTPQQAAAVVARGVAVAFADAVV